MTDLIRERLKTYQHDHQSQGRLLISCPDRTGIVAAVSKFLNEQNCNIVESSQYSTNPKDGLFFIRIVFECLDSEVSVHEVKAQFQPVAEEFEMDWVLHAVSQLKRVALMVSKELHALQELLWEWQSGNLNADIALIVSNHEEARDLAVSYGLPFYHIPANKSIRQDVETRQKQLFADYQY